MRSIELSPRRFGRRLCARLANRTASFTDRARVSGRNPEIFCSGLLLPLKRLRNRRLPHTFLSLRMIFHGTMRHGPRPLCAQFRTFRRPIDLPESGRKRPALNTRGWRLEVGGKRSLISCLMLKCRIRQMAQTPFGTQPCSRKTPLGWASPRVAPATAMKRTHHNLRLASG